MNKWRVHWELSEAQERTVSKALMDLIVNIFSVLRLVWVSNLKLLVKPGSKQGIRSSILLWDKCTAKK